MNNAELYHKNNALQKRDAMQCLEEYGKLIKWKNDRFTVLDIGCGDGTVTMDVLKKYIPNNCDRLVGCDVSKNMIQFANDHYANNYTSFIVLDVEGDLPKELRGTFDHAFSFYALHWIQDQKLAFTNIYDLLSEGGECFLLFLAHTPVFDVYRVLARNKKWKFYLKNAECYISPYHDCQEPDNEVNKIMTSIGFSSVEVQILQKTFTYHNLDDLKGYVTSVNPFEIPQDLEEDFLQDYLNVLRDIHDDQASKNDDGLIEATFNYSLVLAMGKK